MHFIQVRSLMETSMRSDDQVQFETNTKLVEVNCKQAFMDDTKPSKHVFQRSSSI